MKEKKHISFMKNIIALMASQLIIKIFGLIYKIYLTNKNGFGDIGNAIFSSAFQIYALFLTVSSIGIPNAIASLISTRLSKDDKTGAYRIFKVAITIFGIVGFTLSTILFVMSHKIANIYLAIPEAEWILKTLSPSIFIVSIEAVLEGFFNGREQIGITAKAQSIEQGTKTILTIIMVEVIGFLSNENTCLMVQIAGTMIVLSNIVSSIYLMRKYILNRNSIYTDLRITRNNKKEKLNKIIKNIFAISIPISLSAMLSTANKTIDAFTIIRLGAKVVGSDVIKMQYGILSGKIDALISLPYSFNIAFATALIPTIAALKTENNIKLAKKRIEFSIIATILIGLPCSAIFSIFSKQILELLFPNASLGSNLLNLSAWSIIIVVMMQTVNGALQGLGKAKIPVISLFIGCIIKIILNLILIPIESLNIKGAIISTIISQLITLVICMIGLKKTLNINRFSIKPVIATLIMIVIMYISYNSIKVRNQIKFIIALLIGIISYGCLIISFKILSKEEIYMIPYAHNTYRKITNIKKRTKKV